MINNFNPITGRHEVFTNLYTEIVSILEENCKSIDDLILAIDSHNKTKMDIEEFLKSAKYINYENGYGEHCINSHIKLLGKDFWLERETDDGREWWEFKQFPNSDGFTKAPIEIRNISLLKRDN